jgi:hypothetical protein
VAERCEAGIVIPKDDAEAYYWLTIAVTRAPADKQPELAGRRDAAGEKLDPAARGEVQARCRDYRPAAPASSMSSK